MNFKISKKCYQIIATLILVSLAGAVHADEGRVGKGRYAITWTDRDPQFSERIQEFYDTETAKKALTIHINNLLRFYAFKDDRIVATNRYSTPSRHSVHVSSEGDLISMNQYGYGNKPFREDRFSVFGVNHFVNYECSHSAGNCWLIHPVTKQRWLQIVENEDAALELSRAISELIRELQST